MTDDQLKRKIDNLEGQLQPLLAELNRRLKADVLHKARSLYGRGVKVTLAEGVVWDARVYKNKDEFMRGTPTILSTDKTERLAWEALLWSLNDSLKEAACHM